LFVYSLIACNLRVMVMVQLNTKKRSLNITFRFPPGLCPSAGLYVVGPVTPFSPYLKSVSRLLFQEPCLLRGCRAGLPSFLLPSPSSFSQLSAFICSTCNLLRAYLAPPHRASLPIHFLLCQPPCCPSSPLSPHLRRCCKSEILI
jgi:hypothetical protein